LLHPYDIALREFSLNFTETPDAVSNQDDDDELRLVNDLFFSGYNKNVRPTKEKELPIEVKFGIAYTQIVDLVGQGSRHFLESF